MQSPDQEGPEENIKQVTDETPEQQEFQPIYEFPATPSTQALPETVDDYTSVNEPAPQGFVYPPPPSFYEKMDIPAQQAPIASSASSDYKPVTVPQMPIHGGSPPYPVPPAPPFMPQPPVKKSYKWVWIIVSLLSALLLVSCSLCGWGFYNLFSSTYQQVSGSIDVVNDFYTNLQAKNYHAAYSDLAPQGQISGLSESEFVSLATERDNNYGPVASFVQGQPNFGTSASGPDLAHCTITVDVKRTHQSYMTLLSLSKLGKNWKIVSYDQI
jgi:hypothetical protein